MIWQTVKEMSAVDRCVDDVIGLKFIDSKSGFVMLTILPFDEYMRGRRGESKSVLTDDSIKVTKVPTGYSFGSANMT